MKKILKLVLSSIAVFSLVACGPKQTQSNSEDSSVPPLEVYYHVTFLNDDETLLYEVDVLEGQEAVYGGETPTKEEDDEFTYTFKEWDQDLSRITEDVTTKAVYEYIPKENSGPIIWA